MPRFSASLGYLWSPLPLTRRIRAAAAAGFAAVECHWPYQEDPAEVRAALEDTGLVMLSLNTPRGDVGRGEFGVAALPGRGREARRGIDLAVDYAAAIGAGNVHVMSGISGDEPAARDAFLQSLAYAEDRAAPHGVGILIEPINRRDRPGYFLHRVAQARAIIDELGKPSVRMMFDCYHVQRTEGDLATRLAENIEVIGHIQIAGVPDRGEPDAGEVDYAWLLGWIDALGYRGHIGAEYVPRAGTEEGLHWYLPYRPDR